MTTDGTSRRILLHIGWPKTGTTTLQKHAFGQLKDFRYLGKMPFGAEKNRWVFNFINLAAYCSEEMFLSMEGHVFQAIRAQERALYGDVAMEVPALISDEGFLSTLLKPSDHQHHGYSTASLKQMVDRLAQLEVRWNARFEVLICERTPMELLHAYYAQLFHIISAFPGLGSFGKYITVGTSNQPGRDLGFHYLRPGLVAAAFREQLGRDRVFSINMKDLFSPGMIHLGRWHPDFHDLPLGNMDVENKRTVANDVKIAHIRPIWVKRIPFKLIPFLKEMRSVN